MILILSIVVLTLMLLVSWYKKRRFYALASRLPGPTAYPLIGNLMDFASVGYDILEVLKVMNKYHGIARFWLGQELTVAITDPEYLEVLYNSNALLARPDQYKPIEDWVGEGGLVTAGGDQWRKARRIMIQAFHSIPPEEMASTMESETKLLIDNLRKHIGAGFIEMSPMIRKNGCAIITRIGINESLTDISDLGDVLHSIEELTRISVMRFLSPIYYFDAIFALTKDGRIFNKLKRNLRDVIKRIVNKKKSDYDELIRIDEKPSNAFIYRLFGIQDDLSLEDITTHLLTLMASAIDTTADTIGFTLLMAAVYPEVQERLHQEDKEIQERLGGSKLGPSDIQHYHYLDRVVKETLRLFPGFPMTGRCSTEEVKLGKYVIPTGTNVLALNFFTNRREDLFENANTFDPSRFLPENANKIHPYAFLPFGAGLRNCAGTKYSLLAIKIEIILLLRAFKITSEYKNQQELEENLFADIVLRDKNHVRLKLEERI